MAIPNTKHSELDPALELWAGLETFTTTNAIPGNRRAEISLPSNPRVFYKLVMNLAHKDTPTASQWQRWRLTWWTVIFYPKNFIVK